MWYSSGVAEAFAEAFAVGGVQLQCGGADVVRNEGGVVVADAGAVVVAAAAPAGEDAVVLKEGGAGGIAVEGVMFAR